MTRPRTPSVRDVFESVTEREFVTELGVVASILVGLQLFVSALDEALDPFFLDSDPALTVVRGAFVLVGFGGLAAAYAVWRGHSLPVGVPERTDGYAVGVTVLAAVVLGAVVWVPFALAVGFSTESLVSPLASLEDFVLNRTMLRIAVFAPAGALVYHALVQSGLRRVLDRNLTVVVTAVLGAYLTSSLRGVSSLWFALSPERAVLGVVLVVALAVAAYARERTDLSTARTAAALVVLGVIAVIALAIGSRVATPQHGVGVAGRVALIGVGAYAYERTDSLLPPILAYVAFSAVTYYFLSASLYAAFGGAW